jgi:hypothetical protein
MSYLQHLKHNRWTKVGSKHYSMTIGQKGRDGIVIKTLTKQSEKNIENWFQGKSIVLQGDGPLWWSFQRFSNYDGAMWSGGYEFKMSLEAYKKMFLEED